ncbi:hypothetical protein ACJ6WF_41635 [Streptomyces sp. MMS24-I2-30]|uniref:hypothetical protein n=1 Tax=Streptomyces sp. MMS24-I2-30 TaxID=3351564 RepID=UPI003896A3FE
MPNYSDVEKKAFLEEFSRSDKTQTQFSKEIGMSQSRFSEWVNESQKYGVDPETLKGRKGSRDVKRILEEWLRDPLERTLADFGAGWARPTPAASIESWARNAGKYGVSQKEVDQCKEGRKLRRLRKVYTDDQKRDYVLGYLGQMGTVHAYAAAVGVRHQLLADWLRNSQKYGVSQELVDLAAQNRREAYRLRDPSEQLNKYGVSQEEVNTEPARRVRDRTVYTDDQRRGYILGYIEQNGRVTEYAAAVGVKSQTLRAWLRNSEQYGVSQELVDLAVQNRRDAHKHGKRDSLQVLPRGLPVAGPAESAGLSGHTDAAQGGPFQPAGWDGERYVNYGAAQGYSPQGHWPMDYAAQSGSYSCPAPYAPYLQSPAAGPAQEAFPSRVAASAAPSPQDCQPDSSSAPYPSSDSYDQYVRSIAAGQVSASHYLPVGYSQFQAGPSQQESRPAASSGHGTGGKSTHRRK